MTAHRDELVQVVVDQVLVVGLLGPGGQVDDARLVAQAIADARDGGVLRAGEYIDGQPPPAQLTCQLAHIDVHPARLLAAKGGERAGMHAEHRNAPDSHRITCGLYRRISNW